MLRFMKKASKKAGLAPGTLVLAGKKKVEEARIRIIDEYETNHEERDLEGIYEQPFSEHGSL